MIEVSGAVWRLTSEPGKPVVGTFDDGLFTLRWKASRVAIAPFRSGLVLMDNPDLGGYLIHKSNDKVGFRF